jgi:hypothetical protein
MKVIIFPGYGDRRDYIDFAFKNWKTKFDLEPEVVTFNWYEGAETYDVKWGKIKSSVQSTDKIAAIGISAGTSLSLRLLQDFPNKVVATINICGPSRLSDLNPLTIKTKYPLLGRSLSEVSIDRIDLSRVLTIRPLIDKVVYPASVYIEGALNHKIFTIGHAPSIAWSVLGKNRLVASFIKDQAKLHG